MNVAAADVGDPARIQKGVKTLFGWLFFRRISVPISLRLARTAVRPLQITALGVVVGLSGAALLATGHYWWALLGASLAIVSKLLDAIDGEVARAKRLDSAAGYIIDGLADRLRDTALIVGAGVGGVRSGEPGALAWTLGAAVGYLLFFYVASVSPAHWREIRSKLDLEDKHMFRVGPSLRLGAGDTLVVALLAAAAAGNALWLVQGMAILAPVAIVVKVRRIFFLRPWERQEAGAPEIR